MATIYNIREITLEKILLYATFWTYLNINHGENLKRYLPLTWVCRKWRKILLPQLFSEAYMEIRSTPSTSDTPDINSNIKLIVENDLSHYVLTLDIRYENRMDGTKDIIDFLNEQHFHEAKWPSVYYLYYSSDILSADGARKSAIGTDSPHAISEYLHTHLPVLTHMRIRTSDEAGTECPLSHLINLKLYRLSSLHVSGLPVAFKSHSFCSSLTDLNLRFGEGQTSLPIIYAPTLRILGLYNVSPDFSWRCFLSDNGDSYEFLKLESMSLSFSSDTAVAPTTETSKYSYSQLPATGTRKFLAPKLEDLQLLNTPLSHTQLFAPLLHLHLNELDISDGFVALSQMNLRFPYSKDVTVDLTDATIADVQAFNEFTEDLFSSFSIATRVTFEAKFYIPLSIKTAGWKNVVSLNITAFISCASLYRLVSQLPVLNELYVKFVTPDDELASINIQQIITTYSPNNTTISNSLQRFAYLGSTSRNPLIFNLDVLYEFVISVTSLKQVTVFEYYLEEVKEHFGQDSMKQFPHVQNIIFSKYY